MSHLPTSTTSALDEQSEQLALGGMEAAFAAVGLETLPHGAGRMSPKQLRFCLRFLDCGNARQAARECGLPEQHASKLMRKGAVSEFLRAAVKPVAQNGDQLVRRKWELSVSWHDELMELRAKPYGTLTESEQHREMQLATMVTRNDTLLAALLNRLGIQLAGEVAHTISQGGSDFVVLPPEALGGFATGRQQVARDRQRHAVASIAP